MSNSDGGFSSDISGILHEWYLKNGARLIPNISPTVLELLSRSIITGGKHFNFKTEYSGAQGVGANYQRALNKSNSGSRLKSAEFEVPYMDIFGVSFVSNKEIKASEEREGAYNQIGDRVCKDLFNQVQRKISRDIFGDGYGSISKVTAAVAGQVITVSDPWRFDLDMDLVFSDTSGASVLRDATAVTVTKVDSEAKKITVSGTIPAAVAKGDFIFIAGDRDNTATPERLNLYGFEAWVPVNRANLTQPFCNVNRDVYASRLAGQVITTVKADKLSEIILQAQMLSMQAGGNINRVVMSPATYQKYIISVGAKESFFQSINATAESGVHVTFGVDKIETHFSDDHRARVYIDPYCPNDRIFCLNIDEWQLAIMGDKMEADSEKLRVPSFENFINAISGAVSVKQPNNAGAAPGVNLEIDEYMNLACFAPGFQVVIDISSGFVAE